MDRKFRNDLNDNFETNEKEHKVLRDDFDNAVEIVSGEAFEKVKNTARIEWLPPVNTYADLERTYPNATEGKTAMARDSGKIYRFDPAATPRKWVEIQDIDPSAFNEMDKRLTEQLAHEAKRIAERGVSPSDYIALIEHYKVLMPDKMDWKPAIDKAITDALAQGKKVILPNGTIQSSGEHILRSKAVIDSAGFTHLKQVQGSMASMFRTLSDSVHTDITLKNISIDVDYKGLDDPSVQRSYHAVRFANIRRLTLENITVFNPIAWCFALTNCHEIQCDNIMVYSEGDQQDGLHFIDCNNVKVDGLYGKTGDDVLGITCDNADIIADYTITNVQGTSKIASLVRLNQSNASVARGERKVLRDMVFRNLIGKNCGNRGFSPLDIHPSSDLINIDVEGIFDNCAREGIRFPLGKRIRVKATISACGKGWGLSGNEKFDSFRANRIDWSELDLIIYDVADGKHGVNIEYGSFNDIIPKIDYVKAGKQNIQFGVKLGFCNYNKVRDGSIVGALRGVQVGSSTETAQRNMVYRNFITDCTGYAISEGEQGNFNSFEDNHLVNTQGIQRQGPNTQWRNNIGFRTENQGSVIIPAGQLSVTVNHGLYAIPRVLQILPRDTTISYRHSRTGSTFTVSIDEARPHDTYYDWMAFTT